ncbi:putative inorganic phosphate cotransporter isoform X1 [Penaeus monodon]|uniref:putative inorganic phosphate cotransporter isoform X1 n=1 Tax=Penaeus monodon TaxID=6687 RepID=UPI0018A7BF6E|nr:putative inorganic phosphate cotransporter isoform X1 [Penaeus monodon]XP_037786839.1 putative inorganic phosphate cotransporter isoform X1 [Penaeus monodon]
MTGSDPPQVGTNGDVVHETKPSQPNGDSKEPTTLLLALEDPVPEVVPAGGEGGGGGGTRGGEKGGCWQVRFTLAILSLLGIVLMYAMRVCLSIAIVGMVGTEQHHHGEHNGSEAVAADDTCPSPEQTSGKPKETIVGEFSWDETTQGIILGSFFWGYACTNIPGGRLAEYFGGKRVFGLGIVLSALFTVLTPLSARASTELFIAVRIFCGAVQGVVFPAVNSMLATWIPPFERSRFSTIVYSGFPLGTVLSLPIGGWLCSSTFLGGWPSVFYLFGGLGIVWGIFWFILIHDRPEAHPRISASELAHIQAFAGQTKRAEGVPLPWKDLLMSLPFWGLLAGSLGYDYGFYTLLTELPTYLKNIQHFDMSSNGLISALPFLVMWLWGYIWGLLMDRLTKAKILSIITIRRLSMSVALYGAMISLVIMCFVNCDPVLAVVVLCLSVGLGGSANCGFLCSHQDIAPNFAGTLLGITNAVGAFAGVFAPMITGAITEGNQTLSAWRFVFLITVGIYLVTGSLYVFLISERPQYWNEPKFCRAGKDCSENEVKVSLASTVTTPTSPTSPLDPVIC